MGYQLEPASVVDHTSARPVTTTLFGLVGSRVSWRGMYEAAPSIISGWGAANHQVVPAGPPSVRWTEPGVVTEAHELPPSDDLTIES